MCPSVWKNGGQSITFRVSSHLQTTGLEIKLVSAFFYPVSILLVLPTAVRIPTGIINRFSSGALLYSLFSLGTQRNNRDVNI